MKAEVIKFPVADQRRVLERQREAHLAEAVAAMNKAAAITKTLGDAKKRWQELEAVKE